MKTGEWSVHQTLEISERDLDPKASGQRLVAYRNRFPDVQERILAEHDADSRHFQVMVTGQTVGGFRLTPIGCGTSEVESMFKNFPFVVPSYEFGRFWMANQNQGHGRGTIAEVFTYLRFHSQRIYFKTSAELGAKAKEFYARDEGVTAPNWKLGYRCVLFSLGT